MKNSSDKYNMVKFNFHRLLPLACALLLSVQQAFPQSSCQQEYRRMVLGYSRGIKAAVAASEAASMKAEAARRDLYPKLSASASAGYTVVPIRADIPIEGGGRLLFEGSSLNYGLSLSLEQPLYAGGSLRAALEQARLGGRKASELVMKVTGDALLDADIYYWNYVAAEELVSLAEDFMGSVDSLVTIVGNMVEAGYADSNDLLMAEVRRNDATYQLLRARNGRDVARMAMNSFAGADFDDVIPSDTAVAVPDAVPSCLDSALARRPEMLAARSEVEMRKAGMDLEMSAFRPKFSIVAQGVFETPGYDLRRGPNPDGGVYAKLTVPVLEWGKARKVRRSSEALVSEAEASLEETADMIALEVEQSMCSCSQALEQVRLTENSLQKAAMSEALATDRYKQGRISLVEVIDAQINHQQARLNNIQARLDAQVAASRLQHACGSIFAGNESFLNDICQTR